ncbi:MAG TPA: M20/M25/M40 family metallo-hydrolase [Candidatus Acidoferrum sp.]|nr:M20/M25/M40 family metallo-hydrolase [Candidatus Acidoferrum sp.]
MARTAARIWILVLAGVAIFSGSSFAQSRRQSATATIPSPPPQSVSPASSDLTKLESDALVWLQGLLRINTTNPPGNELVAAKYVADILKQEGIHSDVIETTPGRGFLVARLSASAVPDPSRALLLMGHLDVVGVEKAKWTVDPFGAVIKDGYLYGRGAIDDKAMAIANLAVFIGLKRSSAHLNRDVIYFAEGDEEAGGLNGMKVAVEKYWDKIAAGYAINEGGYNALKDGKLQYMAVQASEKVSVSVEVIATGVSGHGSLPRKDNPVTHLAAAIAKIGGYETPVQMNSVTRGYFDGLAQVEDEETAKWMRSLESSDRGEHAARYLSNENLLWNAMLRDTISPTMLQAGVRPNVIPSEARGVINMRLLPGDMPSALIAKLSQLVSDPQIRFEVIPGAGEAAPSSSLTTDLYNEIASATKKQFPGAIAIPFMSPGATDSYPLRMRNVAAYGLMPFPLAENDFLRMHADDERIPLESFRKGVDFIYAIVNDFAVSR